MFMSEPEVRGRSVNRAELAGVCGVSLPTVDAWVEKGCPFVQRGSKGREWQFDTAAVINWRVDRAVQEAVAGLQGEAGQISKDEADRRKAVANAISAEVAADEALRIVVSRHDAAADVAAFCQVLKTGLSNAASKMAARATTITNASEIEAMLQAEMNRAFAAAREEIATRWLGQGDGADGRSGEGQPAQDG